jgi:hypothetical protein
MRRRRRRTSADLQSKRLPRREGALESRMSREESSLLLGAHTPLECAPERKYPARAKTRLPRVLLSPVRPVSLSQSWAPKRRKRRRNQRRDTLQQEGLWRAGTPPILAEARPLEREQTRLTEESRPKRLVGPRSCTMSRRAHFQKTGRQ